MIPKMVLDRTPEVKRLILKALGGDHGTFFFYQKAATNTRSTPNHTGFVWWKSTRHYHSEAKERQEVSRT
jgi:hypothetical protein